MTVEQLLLELHRDYLENVELNNHLSMRKPLTPLSFARFVGAICLLITGNHKNEQGVLERYRIYRRFCLQHNQKLVLHEFVAASILSNQKLDQDIRAQVATACGATRLPMVMN